MSAVAMATVKVAVTPAVMPVAAAAVMPAPITMMVMVAIASVTAPSILRRDDPALGWISDADGRRERCCLCGTAGEGGKRQRGCQDSGP